MSMRARAILVLTVTALALGMAYPTYQGEGEGLHLGLDLQGGIHWLLGVDQAQAIEAELGRVRENLAELGESALGLTNEEIKEQIQLQPDQLVVSGVPEASLNDLLAEEFVGLSPTAIGDTTVLTLSSSRVEQVLRDATAQAIEVLQRRAAGVVREPIIASEGIGRILVQMPGEVLYVPTGWHQAQLNLVDALAVNSQIATPTHMPLQRDVVRFTDPQSGADFEVNEKTGEMWWAPDPSDVGAASSSPSTRSRAADDDDDDDDY